MPVMFGKGLSITYLGKINFGLSIHIWSNSLVNTKKQEIYFKDGWNGVQGKKLGWPSSNIKKEWVSMKMQRQYFTDIWRHFQV